MRHDPVNASNGRGYGSGNKWSERRRRGHDVAARVLENIQLRSERIRFLIQNAPEKSAATSRTRAASAACPPKSQFPPA